MHKNTKKLTSFFCLFKYHPGNAEHYQSDSAWTLQEVLAFARTLKVNTRVFFCLLFQFCIFVF